MKRFIVNYVPTICVSAVIGFWVVQLILVMTHK